MAVATRCDQCGQTDDHPMVHFGAGGRSVHFDCMSADERDIAPTEVLAAADAAANGLKGDDLRAAILEGTV